MKVINEQYNCYESLVGDLDTQQYKIIHIVTLFSVEIIELIIYVV